MISAKTQGRVELLSMKLKTHHVELEPIGELVDEYADELAELLPELTAGAEEASS